jgi:cobalt-precorrin-5B (C1)-methyltransferase
VRLLFEGVVSTKVQVRLPKGGNLTVAVAYTSFLKTGEAQAIVIKDAGDDPDVTNRAEIGTLIRRQSKPGLNLTGGRGVGRVTKPGLALSPGEWAINPVPRTMLRDNLAPFCHLNQNFGLMIEIFVEKGEELAALTLNPRLGIVGGVSILGTTGLVKPFSVEAYLSTIDSSLSLAQALNLTEVILSTGRQSEKLAMRQRPDLPSEAFVQIADFFGDSLEMAATYGFTTIGLAVFFGKAVKQAVGYRNTHARYYDQDPVVLARWLNDAVGLVTLAAVREALTARNAWKILKEAGVQHLATARVKKLALAAARKFTGPGPRLHMTIFDYQNDL